MSTNAYQTIPAALDAGQSTTTSNVVPFRADIAQDQQPAPAKKRKPSKPRTKHPLAKPRPCFTGKDVRNSPYYLDPVTRLKFIGAMVRDPELPPAALKAMVLLLEHYNHREGVARPGEKGLGDKIKTTRQTVSGGLNKAVELGWLQIASTRNGNRNGPNHYVPVLTKAALKFGKTGHSGDVNVGFSKDDCRDSSGLNVGFSDPSLSAKPDTNLDREPGEMNPEREPSTPKGAISLDLMEAWFALFWKAYPRQDDEPAARREFERIMSEDGHNRYEELMDNLMAYKEHVGGEILFKPANWLSKGQWRVTRTASQPVAPKRHEPRWS